MSESDQTTKQVRKYKVIRGMFTGKVFNGSYCGGRVWNEDTYGQSYPEENCEVIQ